MAIVRTRKFHFWKLEKWWVFCNDPEFYPKGRIHLTGDWFYRI